MVSKISLVLIKSIPPENQLKRGRFRRAGTSPAPTLQLPKTSRCRGRHPRAASLAPAGQFAFCPHRPAPIILYPRRRGGPRGRPRAGTSPVPTYWCGVRPALGAPHEPSEAVRVGKRSRSGRSELCRWRRSEGSGACGDAVTLRVGRMAGSLNGHSAKHAAGLRPACFFASMSS